MDGLRFVQFTDAASFLEATKEYDDSFMGYSIGTLLDELDSDGLSETPSSSEKGSTLTGPVPLFAIYRGDELQCVNSSHQDFSFSWHLSVPHRAAADALTPDHPDPDPDPDSQDSDESLAAATALLATSALALLPDPLALKEVRGPVPAVERLVDVYVGLLRDRGIAVRVVPGRVPISRVGYATRESVPPLPTLTPSRCGVAQAGEADMDALVELVMAFRMDVWGEAGSGEEVRAFLARPVARGLVWVCRVEPDSKPVGYVVLGRVTPRTIAFRNVFVAEEYRRKGIGETMVCAVTRYYLGMRPHGVQGVADDPPPTGWKEEVNLNVVDACAERMYKRAGFLFPDWGGDVPKGGIDPTTARRAWYPATCRVIERMS
ncbi:hypothetical protein C8Q76DRAFT_610063 [Earliella scabrosa]|nr:hypothetical protein C8Q76DRAFT_610063 [Earliella scabrosa]